MRIVSLIICTLLFHSCKNIATTNYNAMNYAQEEILKELDLAYRQEPGKFFPQKTANNILYNFFPDLEMGYCHTAGNRIHLYGDGKQWAIVFEKSGYQNRGFNASAELIYIGNCIEHIVEQHNGRTYISNTKYVELISQDEFNRVKNTAGDEMDQFEKISPDAKNITVHGQSLYIEQDLSKYKKFGIEPSSLSGEPKYVGYADLVRYIHETEPRILNATEEEIKQHIPKNLAKLMTIDSYYFICRYEDDVPPSEQETYQLIAKILVDMDSSKWQPTAKPNNHWKNWESGTL